jgi:hypothetical protein
MRGPMAMSPYPCLDLSSFIWRMPIHFAQGGVFYARAVGSSCSWSALAGLRLKWLAVVVIAVTGFSRICLPLLVCSRRAARRDKAAP